MGVGVHQKTLLASVLLGTLALCALFLAQGVTSLAAVSLFPLNTANAYMGRSTTADSEEPPGSRVPDIKVILARNIFDSSTGALWPPPAEQPAQVEEEEAPEEVVLDPNNPPPPCTDPVKLVASIYSASLPEWSFASMAADNETPMLYRQGGHVGEFEVLAIYPRAVFLRPGRGRPCSVAMFTEEEQAPSRSRPKPTVAKAKPGDDKRTPGRPTRPDRSGGIGTDELKAGIQKVSGTQYNVSRSLVDKVLQNQAALMRSARIVPQQRGGQVMGVKLYGIRRNSLLGQLGMQNGDLLRTINGYDMTSPDSALEAYSRLRNADNLTVAVERRGKNLNLSYHIQ